MNKQLFYFVFIMLGLTATLNAQTITYPTFSGNSTVDDRFYAFSGSSADDFSSFGGDDWTYELWIKVDPASPIGDRTAASGKTAGGTSIGERSGNWELYLIDDDNADYAIKFGRLTPSNDIHITSMQSNDSAINLSFDEWVHVAVSRSSSDGVTKFYLNGTLVDSSSDALWVLDVNDNWLDFNYMYRNDSNINFFKGSYDNIRISRNDRYPVEFTPDQTVIFTVDADTFLQMDLNNNLTPFDPPTDFDKVEIKGTYPYYIKIHNSVFWTTENLGINDEESISFSLYPNPSGNNNVTISCDGSLNDIVITNLLGEVVLSKTFKNNTNQISLDTANFSSGTYLLSINTTIGFGVKKLIIK